MDAQLKEAFEKYNALEIVLLSNAEPGIIGENYLSRSPTKSGHKGKSQNSKGGKQKVVANSKPPISPGLPPFKFFNKPPPIMNSNIENDILPQHFFAPSQELMQILIRKAIHVNHEDELDRQLILAMK